MIQEIRAKASRLPNVLHRFLRRAAGALLRRMCRPAVVLQRQDAWPQLQHRPRVHGAAIALDPSFARLGDRATIQRLIAVGALAHAPGWINDNASVGVYLRNCCLLLEQADSPGQGRSESGPVDDGECGTVSVGAQGQDPAGPEERTATGEGHQGPPQREAHRSEDTH